MDQGDIVLVQIANATAPALIVSRPELERKFVLLLPITTGSALNTNDLPLLDAHLRSGRLLQSARVQIDGAFSLPPAAIGKTVAGLKNHILEEVLYRFQEQLKPVSQ